MDLLSPAESQAFQSFLSSLDYNDPNATTPAPEWGMYNGEFAPDDILLDVPPPAQGKEALTKATKDLMSLDAAWDANMQQQQQTHCHQPQQQHQVYDQNGHIRQFDQRQSSFSQRHEPFPFLNAKPQQQQHQQHSPPPLQHRQQHQQQHQQHLSTSPLHAINTSSDYLSPSSGSYSSATTSSASPHSPHFFSPPPSSTSISSQHQQHHPHQAPILPAPPSAPQLHVRPPSPRSVGKRPSDPGPSTCASKRSRPSPPALQYPAGFSSSSIPTSPNPSGSSSSQPKAHSQSQSQSSQSQQPHLTSRPTHTAKQTLLSPSQKKANHIQSEQKRRANIRRGYEALCETVPALREAIREEEEAEAARAAGGGGDFGGASEGQRRGEGANGAGNGGTKGKGKKRGKKGKGEEEKEKDKIDGRAGPRSENVVLSKTIDYINDLLSERSGLLARLHRARSMLPPGHDVLVPLQEPLWEREWKGGEGRLDDEDAEGGGEDGGGYAEEEESD